MTFAMYDRLAKICEEAGSDPAMRALVLTGAGEKAFASGTDISQFREFKTPQDALDYEQRIDRVLVALERCPIPTIAVVAGACTGGGAGMAAACDLRIATKASRFGFPVARTLGNCLSISNYTRLAALVGPAAVKDMVFTARLLGADEAKSVGFINEVVEDRAALDARADELAKQVASMAPLTLRATKEALYRIRERSAARGRAGPDRDVLHEPGFPRGIGRVPDQAHATTWTGINDRGRPDPRDRGRHRDHPAQPSHRCTTGWSRRI